MWPQVRDQRLFLATLAGVVALTWVSLWRLGRSPYAQLAHAHGGDHGGAAWTVYLSLAGWMLMVAAMMLPTTFPLVALFHSFVRERALRTRLTRLLIAGYLWIWTLFGFVVYAGNRLLHGVVEQSAWLSANVWTLATGTLLLAGIYQFTPLKRKCLEKCRSPFSFIMQHWHGKQEEQEAFHLGMHHGLFCIGCCWSLMLLMFVVGIGNLAWMLGVGAIMAVEKNVSWGRRLSAPLGVGLICSAAALITTHSEWT